ALFARVDATYIDPLVLKAGHLGHLFIAARTATFGMAIGSAALLLLGHAVEHPASAYRACLPAFALVGALPLVHGHSFLALALVGASYTWLARHTPRPWLAGAALAALLALPQLAWLSAQGSTQALRWSFGLLRPASSPSGWLRDVALDLGLWLVLIPLGFACTGPRARRLAAPLLALLPIANCVAFTPALYDNIKLLAWFDLAAAPLAAAAIWRLFGSPEDGGRVSLGRRGLVATCTLGATASGLFAIGFELCNDAVVASHDDVRFAAFVAKHTRAGDVIATAASYHDPIALFSGRRVLVAAPGMLATHGIDVRPRAHELVTLYAGGPSASAVIEHLHVVAVVVGPRERADLPRLDEVFLARASHQLLEQAGRRLYLLVPDPLQPTAARGRIRAPLP
ncbi:MAG: hypothetical protein ABW321_13560, partial [Polyangiales bacterium]